MYSRLMARIVVVSKLAGLHGTLGPPSVDTGMGPVAFARARALGSFCSPSCSCLPQLPAPVKIPTPLNLLLLRRILARGLHVPQPLFRLARRLPLHSQLWSRDRNPVALDPASGAGYHRHSCLGSRST